MTLRRPLPTIAALSVALAAPAPALAAGLCPAWQAPQAVGLLDTDAIPEASGLEWSAAYPTRLYHNNDSGDGPYFYVTDSRGANARRVAVEGFDPRDVEDIAVGPCGEETCLFLADIGDNARRRSNVRIVVAPEPADLLPDSVTPRTIITATYPDGAHNAESAAMHPNGDLFVLTKVTDGNAQLFRLTAAQIAAGGDQEFAAAGRIDIAAATGGETPRTREATAMDIAADGGRFVVLTYQAAIEFAVDLSQPLPGRLDGGDYRLIQTRLLPQAEAIAYAGDGRSVIYDSEAPAGFSEIPLVLQLCGDEPG